MMKKINIILFAILFTGLIFMFPSPAGAVNLIINGMRVKLDTDPVMRNGIVFVPLRGIFERLGATVTYEKSTQTVAAQRRDTTVLLTTGNSFATINGSRTRMMSPPFQMQNRTYVPLRFISESLGCQVGWHPPTRTVAISSQAGKDPFDGVDMDELEMITLEDKKKTTDAGLDSTMPNPMKYLMQKHKDEETEKKENQKMKIEGIKSDIRSDIDGIKPIEDSSF